MKTVRFICVIFLMLTLASCAKQLPLPTSADQGLLIVPTEGIRHASGKFVYRYQFDFNDTDNVVIDVGIGKAFIPKVLKAGTYSFDSVKTFGINKGRSRARSKGISERSFDNSYTFEIKAGEITYFPFGVGAIIKSTGSHSYTQQQNLFELTDELLEEYNILVGQAENVERWQSP